MPAVDFRHIVGMLVLAMRHDGRTHFEDAFPTVSCGFVGPVTLATVL